jgi:hypothetical protein
MSDMAVIPFRPASGVTDRQPLFIICPGRSFSSVICAAIGQHPQMFGLPEVNLFVGDTVGELLDLDIPVFGIRGVANGLKRTLAELMFAEQTEARIEEVNLWLAERRDWTGFQMFEEIRELAKGRIIVDKTPTNTKPDALARLYAAYPDALYLHIARHPRAFARSRQKTKMFEKFMNVNMLEELWLSRNEELLEFGLNLRSEQYLYMRGEDFFETPETYLRQICEWAGLTADAAAIEAMMHPETSPFASVGPDNAKFGNNTGFIESPELRVGKVKAENLDDPLDWFGDREVYFSGQTRDMCALLGYDR